MYEVKLTREEVSKMGEKDFVEHYLQETYKTHLSEDGSLKGYESWKNPAIGGGDLERARNNAVDVYELILGIT